MEGGEGRGGWGGEGGGRGWKPGGREEWARGREGEGRGDGEGEGRGGATWLERIYGKYGAARRCELVMRRWNRDSGEARREEVQNGIIATRAAIARSPPRFGAHYGNGRVGCCGEHALYCAIQQLSGIVDE